MMKQDKNNFKDLLSQIQHLNEKYQINDFNQELKGVFEIFDIDTSEIQNLLQNPFSPASTTMFDKVDQQKLADCVRQYNKIKKKYNYESYVREGHTIRKNFLRQRKNYIFNSSKFVRFVTKGKSSAIEKLNIDFAEQKFIAKWVDKLLKKIFPKTLVIEYEKLDGTTHRAEIQHRKVEINSEYVDAPLIDRFVGENLFDIFLLHSFYSTESKNYEYVPIKFIIRMYSKDNPMMQFEDEES